MQPSAYLSKLSVLVILPTLLSGCTKVNNWLAAQEEKVEARQALHHENQNPQPVSAMFVVQLPDGSSKETNMSFNGTGLARMFEATPTGGPKTIIDYKVGVITKQTNGNPYTTKTFAVDEYAIPPVFDAKGATAAGASCLGSGVLKGHEYHRWRKKTNLGFWEVWTDDDGVFPVHFHSSRDGAETTWTLRNAWIDQGIAERPAFFDFSQADPPLETAPEPAGE